METYETLFITSPTLAEEEERVTVETLAEIVSGGGGTMVANERWGRRRLAYPIEKHEDGVYIRFLYDSGVDVPKELERRIKLSDKVLRALTVRLTQDWAADAKKQAVIDAERRIERAREEAEAKAKAEAEEAEKAEQAAAAAAAAPAVAESVTTDEAGSAAPAEAQAPVEPAKAAARSSDDEAKG